MKIDETIKITASNGSTAEIKKHKRNLFSLTLSRPSPRNRWGTWKEIEEDKEYFITNGQLPPPKGPRW